MKKSKALMSATMIGLTVCIGLTATPIEASARKAYNTYTASRTSTTSVYSDLWAAKAAAKALNPADYVNFSNVTKALAMPERSYSQKIAKTKAINTAVSALVKKSVSADLTTYSAALAAVKQADYTASSWSAYQAVVAANSVTASNTQAEVDAAASAIKAAQAKLVKVVDANLAAAKAAAAALNANDYVDFSKVTNALAMAEGTDAEKASKTSGINSAISSLVKKSVSADLTTYSAALAAVKQADYTASSWSAYQAVVTANSVTASNTQAEVDAAALAIKAAQAKLVKVVDANLAAAKAAAAALNANDYVDFSKVTNALAMAEGTDAEKASKTSGINSAISSLVKKSSVSADLTAYSATLAAVKQADYTASSWSAYQAVVTANSVTASNTQAEVDAAASAIKAAQAKLVKVVDANLAAAKAAAAALNANDYVDFSKVTNALAMAEGTDAEKASKTSGINSAISSLVKKSSVSADLTAYSATLAAVKQADYTASSWSAYQAVVAANSVTASNTQAEVDAAASAIKAAQAKLVKVVDANLAAAKAAAAALNANDYVDFSVVANALAMAEGTDAEKAAKTSAINSGISALVKKSVGTDLTAYNAALTAVKSTDYTVASWNAYQAVVAANTATASSTQTQVNAAASAIKTAQNSLVKTAQVSVKTYGAKGDGVTDDTTAIQNAVNYAASLGGGTVSIPDGTYLINPDTKIKLKSNIRLSLSSNAVLKTKASSSSSYYTISALNLSNIEITGGKVIGNRNLSSSGEGHGIRVVNCKNVRIADVTVTDCRGDGIYVGAAYTGTTGESNYCENVTIERCTVDNSRRNGITITSVKNLLVKDCVLSNSNGAQPEAGIDFEPNISTEFMQNVVVQNLKTINNADSAICVSLSRIETSSNPVSITITNWTDSGSGRKFSDLSAFELQHLVVK